ncbi:AraC family transcriptional regulator [Chitinophaga horti]|uniref:AraC family transcriptional regulator n=1 Tax=Chitinophaga horti TaxID=2920382 RepID=A0ABY6IUX4_9BACT|nr:AraC family transcriptional regulator [Chitinophaga horti]UYQ91182.1 AraC family transcriptional regulator [Chitinophaga horti]
MLQQKRRDGFDGQKLISLPPIVYNKLHRGGLPVSRIFIKHIGYFPKAAHHFRERKKGCADNILIYCLRGKGWYMLGNKLHHVGPNQFIHIPATKQYLRYGADDEDPWTIYWVHYSGPEMKDFNVTLRISEKDGPQDIVFNEKAINIWQDMYQSLEMGYGTDNLMNANLALPHFVSTFLYPEKHSPAPANDTPDLVTDTALFMRAHIASKLTVEDFAARRQLSPSYFAEKFKKATGMSVIDYFIQLKIQKACQLLYDPSMKIKDVSNAVGYEDPYYFSRLFKKLMEISPEQYRTLRGKQR